MNVLYLADELQLIRMILTLLHQMRRMKSMFTLPTDSEYLWLAKQRPLNKRMNRILLLNAKRRKGTAATVPNQNA
jgi:hypothetical protein